MKTASSAGDNLAGIGDAWMTSSAENKSGKVNEQGLKDATYNYKKNYETTSSSGGSSLSGDGLSNGQETLCIGSQGVDGTPASNGMTNLPMMLDVAIPCVGSNQVSVAVAMDTDVGSAQASVTLVFA